MPDESLEVRVAVLQNDVKHIAERLDKALAWGRWIGMAVGGYIIIEVMAILKLMIAGTP